MARYKETEAMAGQGMVMTVNRAEQVIPGTFKHTLHNLVDQKLDRSDFDMIYTNDYSGRPAIHPGVMLQLVRYRYACGPVSSRRGEQISKTNITAKALSCDRAADHATAARFVSRNGA